MVLRRPVYICLRSFIYSIVESSPPCFFYIMWPIYSRHPKGAHEVGPLMFRYRAKSLFVAYKTEWSQRITWAVTRYGGRPNSDKLDRLHNFAILIMELWLTPRRLWRSNVVDDVRLSPHSKADTVHPCCHRHLRRVYVCTSCIRQSNCIIPTLRHKVRCYPPMYICISTMGELQHLGLLASGGRAEVALYLLSNFPEAIDVPSLHVEPHPNFVPWHATGCRQMSCPLVRRWSINCY